MPQEINDFINMAEGTPLKITGQGGAEGETIIGRLGATQKVMGHASPANNAIVLIVDAGTPNEREQKVYMHEIAGYEILGQGM